MVSFSELREVWISAFLPFSLSKLGAARELAAAEVHSPSEKHLNKRPGGALSRAQGSARAALQKLKAAFAVWMSCGRHLRVKQADRDRYFGTLVKVRAQVL